jgi:putative Ca2+/H+ antiporter (TMEM165/GDT1 family)
VCRLAAQLDVVGVIIGSIVGHAACTGAAVLGGKHLAEHIDEKLVGVSAWRPVHLLLQPCGIDAGAFEANA